MANALYLSAGGGRYGLQELLSESDKGKVFRAWDKEKDRAVALKRFISLNPSLENFTLPRWEHPHLVTYYDLGKDENGFFLTMELLHGLSLKKVVDEKKLPLSNLFSLTHQLLAGCAFAHESGFLHHDPKAENVILTSTAGESIQVKIIDFEFSLNRVKAQSPSLYGSISTMAPELFAEKPHTTKTDLYAFGCTLYFAASGQYPFQGANDAEVMLSHLHHEYISLEKKDPAIPAKLALLISQLLSLDPENRPEAREALKRID